MSFISRIRHSKNLSKEIYQQFMPFELDFDTVNGLAKWRSELRTDICFENVFDNISKIIYDYKLQNFNINYYHRILPIMLFWLKLESKILICVAFVILLQILFCITFGNVVMSNNSGNS